MMDITRVAQLIVGGLTIGCVYGLVGLAFAVMLRATDLLNFAQGELVMLGALVGYTLLAVLKVPFFVAFVVASVLVGLFGIFMERFIIRPILTKRSPLLVLLIATVGLSLTMQALGIVVWGAEPMSYPEMGEPLKLAGIVIRPEHLWVLGLALVTVLGFHFFLHRTMTGISWRACALDPDTAALMGVSRKRNVALTFVISSGLGGGAGVLLAPMYFASFNLGGSIIIKSFAAVGLGGFSLIGSIVGGLAVGVTETLAAGLLTSEYKEVITYGILVIVLLLFFRSKRPEGRSVAEAPKTTLVSPLQMGTGRFSFWLRMTVLFLAVAAWLLVPFVARTYALHILILACIYAISVLGLQLIIGYTGQFSFAQIAFFGIGAYTSTLLTMKLGLPFPVALLFAGVVAGTISCLFVPILRLGGHYLAVATIAVQEIIVIFMTEWESITNGAYGIMNIPDPQIGPLSIDNNTSYYFLTTIVLLLVFLFVRLLSRSSFGRELMAIRENELAASSVGINLVQRKAQAFVIGTACAGIGGALYAHFMGFINPEQFLGIRSLSQIVMCVIGGLGSLVGGPLGAILVIALPEFLRMLQEYRMVMYGLLVCGFMLWLPGGMMELFTRAWNRWIFRAIQSLWSFVAVVRVRPDREE